jgi:hypothetical protein
MATAEILLALVQLGRLGMDVYEDYQSGALTDDDLMAAWKAMQTRLGAVSQRIQD